MAPYGTDEIWQLIILPLHMPFYFKPRNDNSMKKRETTTKQTLVPTFLNSQ